VPEEVDWGDELIVVVPERTQLPTAVCEDEMGDVVIRQRGVDGDKIVLVNRENIPDLIAALKQFVGPWDRPDRTAAARAKRYRQRHGGQRDGDRDGAVTQTVTQTGRDDEPPLFPEVAR
jgi:hypothetical protein